MAKLKDRAERLENEAQFLRWLSFSRFLESLTDDQLREVAEHWRFPDPPPDPLPSGMSELDGLDRKTLLRLWAENEAEIAQIMRTTRAANPVDDAQEAICKKGDGAAPAKETWGRSKR